MRRAIAPLILLLLLVAGCEIEKDPVYEPLDPSLLLTDGFCLLANNRVVFNHYDIDYYDFGAHLIYLKSPDAFEEKYYKMGPAAVYADSSKIYDISFVSQVSSYYPHGPVIWYPNIFYPDYTVHIDMAWIHPSLNEDGTDPRNDSRIVEALKKYDQFRHGLQCEILSFLYNDVEGVILELELRNEDPVNYYYWDPEKVGMERYHYVTNGLFLQDESGKSYTHSIQNLSWERADQDRMSLLKSDSSVVLTIRYEQFDDVPPGNYMAYFKFPGPSKVESREDLDLEDGRVWLGDINMYAEVEIQ